MTNEKQCVVTLEEGSRMCVLLHVDSANVLSVYPLIFMYYNLDYRYNYVFSLFSFHFYLSWLSDCCC